MTSMTLPIAADHPAFDGHFPGRPIVPGVVLLDASLEAIGPSVAALGGTTRCRIGAAKFLSMVGPGEPVRLAFEASDDGLSFRLQVYAGHAELERLAMTGNVRFASG